MAQLDGAGGYLHCPAASLYSVTAQLRAAGCRHVSITQPDYIFEPQNALYDNFVARINDATS